jgi:competence protein ComEC
LSGAYCVHAILIQTPSGQQVLVDGGPDPDKICLELGEELPFWDKSLDLVLLTHAEDDHILGLLEVLSRYKVKQVMEPGFENDNVAYQEWLRLIDEKNITRTVARAGQQIELGDGIRMEVLHPQEEFVGGSDEDVNNNSVVLRLVWKEISFLLTGDIGDEAERQMLYQGAELDSTVLKVAHHGSAGSTSQHFLAAVDPQVAVICVGTDNPFGHPSPEVMERLEKQVTADSVYLTSEGTVKFTTDGKRLWVDRTE